MYFVCFALIVSAHEVFGMNSNINSLGKANSVANAMNTLQRTMQTLDVHDNLGEVLDIDSSPLNSEFALADVTFSDEYGDAHYEYNASVIPAIDMSLDTVSDQYNGDDMDDNNENQGIDLIYEYEHIVPIEDVDVLSTIIMDHMQLNTTQNSSVQPSEIDLVKNIDEQLKALMATQSNNSSWHGIDLQKSEKYESKVLFGKITITKT